MPDLKPIYWVASSRRDLRRFAAPVRERLRAAEAHYHTEHGTS